MPKSRKEILAKLIETSELNKFAQDIVEEVTPGDIAAGEQVAEQIFDKLLNELDIDSVT